MTLIFLVPAKNESPTVGEVVTSCFEVARRMRHAADVVVIDDQSTDGTTDVARRAGAKVSQNAGTGLADAFRTGVALAIEEGAEYICHLDADGQYDAGDFESLFVHVNKSNLVIGDRLARGRPPGMSDFRWTWNRHLTQLVSTMVQLPAITDSQSGFRVFHRDIANAISLRGSFTYTQEQILRAATAGIEIRQVPIRFGARRAGDHSRLTGSGFSYLRKVFDDLDRVAADLAISSERLVFADTI